MPIPTLILASASPRRKDILQQLGFQIECCPADIDETPYPQENAQDYVLRMAIEKNFAAQKQLSGSLNAHQPLISADTTVALNNQILGKPRHPNDAQEMLLALSANIHQVLTAVCVFYQGQLKHTVQQSDVQFKTLSAAEIAAYIATGEPMDKAGAYGIQGIAGTFVQHLSGSFTGVMGLPVFETMQLLQQVGINTPPFQAV